MEADGAALFAPLLAVDVTGMLAGRLFRCKTWLGPPNVGFRAVEKSTFVRQRMEIRGVQSSET